MTDLISGITADISRAHGREKETKPVDPKKGKATKNGASPPGSSTPAEKLRDPIPTKSDTADEGSVGTGPTTRQAKPAHNMAAAVGSDATTAIAEQKSKVVAIENCDKLVAPRVNECVRDAIKDGARMQDSVLQNTQKTILKGLMPIIRLGDSFLKAVQGTQPVPEAKDAFEAITEWHWC